MFRKNVDLGDEVKLSTWRKLALGTWAMPNDPTTYGILEYDAAPALAYIEELRRTTGLHVTLTHVASKAIAEAWKRHPDLNCMLRMGKLYRRKSVDVFFSVAGDTKGEELSGAVIRSMDQKSVVEIVRESQSRIAAIKDRSDPDFKKVKKSMQGIPGLLVYPVLKLMGFILYELNLWTPLLGTPRDSFGSFVFSNTGSIGIGTGFSPLIPYSRAPMVCCMSAVRDVPVVEEGKVVPGKRVQFCVSFDHRLIDGMYASIMCKSFEQIFTHPKSELD